ncbi:MAG: hypothetical protein IH960_03130, partial [Chloroflexi bacterium]|nr:hypothetical protein [Chloroflexota bacterium]
IDPDEKFFCQGYLDHPNRYRCYTFQHYGHGHGETNLSDAICRSCNVYFFNAARTIQAEGKIYLPYGQGRHAPPPLHQELPGQRNQPRLAQGRDRQHYSHGPSRHRC